MMLRSLINSYRLVAVILLLRIIGGVTVTNAKNNRWFDCNTFSVEKQNFDIFSALVLEGAYSAAELYSLKTLGSTDVTSLKRSALFSMCVNVTQTINFGQMASHLKNDNVYYCMAGFLGVLNGLLSGYWVASNYERYRYTSESLARYNQQIDTNQKVSKIKQCLLFVVSLFCKGGLIMSSFLAEKCDDEVSRKDVLLHTLAGILLGNLVDLYRKWGIAHYSSSFVQLNDISVAQSNELSFDSPDGGTQQTAIRARTPLENTIQNKIEELVAAIVDEVRT